MPMPTHQVSLPHPPGLPFWRSRFRCGNARSAWPGRSQRCLATAHQHSLTGCNDHRWPRVAPS
jgi:hypothetical protein